MTATPDTTAPLVLREDEDGLVTLRLNRPLQFNALSEAMLAALQDSFKELEGTFAAAQQERDEARQNAEGLRGDEGGAGPGEGIGDGAGRRQPDEVRQEVCRLGVWVAESRCGGRRSG